MTIFSFGQWVRRRRKAMDFTQVELARRVNCAEVTIRKIESDERRPSEQIALALAEVLEIEPADRSRFVGSARARISADRLRSPDVGPERRSSLPVPVTSFIGRSAEIDDLLELFNASGGPARLVTITGPPGTGKTRLALEAARRLERKFDISCVFAELALASDVGSVRSRIAAAVGVPTGASGDRFDLAVAALGREPALVVIDNFEHVLEAAPVIAELLGKCPELTCAVTSRAPLDIYGEVGYPLAPLAWEAADGAAGPASWRNAPAVELFVDRSGIPSARLDLEAQLSDIVSICRILDGLPLAIELAAVRSRRIPPGVLARELAASLDVLGKGGGDRSDRQRTTEGAVRWSYDLLDERDRRALRHASVFAGPFEAVSLAHVCDMGTAEAVAAVEALANHSLLARSQSGERVGMLSVVREFASAELVKRGEEHRARLRHAQLFADRVVTVMGDVSTWRSQPAQELDPDFDDVLAALNWAFGPAPEPNLGCSIAAGIGSYWTLRSRAVEGLKWSVKALDHATSVEQRIALRFWASECAAVAGDFETSMVHLQAAEAEARAAASERWLSLVLGNKGVFALIQQDLDAARVALTESAELADQIAIPEVTALSEMRKSRLALLSGDAPASAQHNDRALAIFRDVGDDWGAGTCMGNSGDLLLADGHIPEAIDAFLLAIRTYLDGDFQWFAAGRLESIGNALCGAGEFECAATAYGMCDQWHEDLGMPPHPLIAPARQEPEMRARQALGASYDETHDSGRFIPHTMGDIEGVCLRFASHLDGEDVSWQEAAPAVPRVRPLGLGRG